MSIFNRVLTSVTKSASLQSFKKGFCSVNTTNEVKKYPYSIRCLHWIIACGFAGSFYTINVALRTEGEEKKRLMSLHESFGSTILLAVIPRMLIKRRASLPDHVPGNFLEKAGAVVGHWGLYFAMLSLPLTGMFMALLGGKGFDAFGLKVPGKSNPTPADGKLARALFLLHRDIGQASEILVLIHMASVPYHWLRGHGNILTRVSLIP